MINRLPYNILFRTSLPLLAASFLLPACGGKNTPSSGGDGDGMGGAGEPVACDTDNDCNDYFYCNGEEECVDGSCRQGEPIDCDDGISCTRDRCDEEDRSCSNTAPDNDGDGHVDGSCEGEDGAPLGDDCDDDDPLSYPGNQEVCDPDHRDEDCNPSTFGTKDSDQDGYVDSACCNVQPNGDLLCGEDCDDNKSNVSPEATEACDFLDNNCDGETDEGVSVTMYEDKDHDGRGDDDVGTVQSCPGAVGFTLIGGDCDDEDPEVFDGQFEICDGKDNNCNGVADEVQEQAPWYRDADSDGYGDAESTPIMSCYRIAGRVLSRNDCDDTENKVNPNATEICDGLDNDCNGKADFKLAGVNNFEDDDDDGAADADCGGPDCDDNDPRTSEGAEEVCDRIDNDCDGEVDEQTVQNIWYIDNDGDGWGVVIGSALASCDPIANRATNFGDCDDGKANIKPGATELCDGIDNDCDGLIDEGAGVRCNLDNALATCRFAQCDIFSCLPGFADADNNAANGCEATVDPVTYNLGPCTDSCNDGNLCNGIESCSGAICRGGPPINCGAGPSTVQGSVTINTGLDIKALEDIETITGDLVINSTALSSLIGLESLRVIGGNLYIQGNNNLIRLSGSALSNLEAVGGAIVIEGNQSLINVSLPSLVSANSIDIIDNDNLAEISGFNQLASIERILHISNNNGLQTIDGFEALGRIGGSYNAVEGGCGGQGGLEIEENYALETISAFPNLTDIDGDLCLYYDTVLGEFELPSLTQIGQYFDVEVMDVLDTISMPALRTVGADIDIWGYNSAEGGHSNHRVISMPVLEGIGGGLYFDGAADTIEQLLFPSLEDVNTINLVLGGQYYSYVADSLTNVDFSGLQTATSIHIDYYANGTGMPVWSFPSLVEIAGDFVFYAQAPITSLEAPLLTQASSLNINVYPQAMQTILFPALTQLDGEVQVAVSQESPLTNVDFGELVTTAGQVYFSVSTDALDISKLTTVGSTNDAELAACVAPFDVCPDVARITTAGHIGYQTTCGNCDQQQQTIEQL